jgi:hypothetical protein
MILSPIRIHATHDNDRCYDDGATNVTGIQSLIEQMYQIIREKSLLKNRLCEGHEPIFRDTRTGRLRLHVCERRTIWLRGSGWDLFCRERFDQVACTADGAHPPAKDAQPGRETGNGSAERADGERWHLSHLLVRLIERQ